MKKHTIEFLIAHKDEPKYQEAYYQYLKEHTNEPEFMDAYTLISKQREHRRQKKAIIMTVSFIIITILILYIYYRINPESFNSFIHYLIEILKHPIIV